MELAKKLYMIALGLCVSLPSYGFIEDKAKNQNLNSRFSLAEQEQILLLMLEKGLIVPSGDGDIAEIKDKGLSILDKLEAEGRLMQVGSRATSICIGFGEN